MRPGYLYFSIFVWYVLSGGRFTAPFLKQIAGFSDSMIGYTFAIQIFLGSIIGSFGAAFADSLEKKLPRTGRALSLGLCVLFAAISFELHFVATFFLNKKISLLFHFIARLCYSICASITVPILDGIALSYLKSTGDQTCEYGKERLFGAIGWAVASLIIGPILDQYGFQTFFISNLIGAGITFVTLVIYLNTGKVNYGIVSMNENSFENQIESGVELIETNTLDTMIENRSYAPFQALIGALKTWSTIGFLFSATTLCMGTSVVENLIFLFFEESLGASNFQCGLTVVVTVIFEIPIFHFAPRILNSVGYQTMQKVACIAYVTRVVGYTLIPRDKMFLVLLLEPLHGVTYACSKTATVQMASEITPDGYEATVQGIISMLTSFGSVIGVSLGGWIEDEYSDISLYRSYAVIVFVGLLFYNLSIKFTRTGVI